MRSRSLFLCKAPWLFSCSEVSGLSYLCDRYSITTSSLSFTLIISMSILHTITRFIGLAELLLSVFQRSLCFPQSLSGLSSFDIVARKMKFRIKKTFII